MQDVASVYRWIVDDVVSKARPEFVHEGVDEATLHELRELWETKLFESGCLDSDSQEDEDAKGDVSPTAGGIKEEDPEDFGAADGDDAADVKPEEDLLVGVKRTAEDIPQFDGSADEGHCRVARLAAMLKKQKAPPNPQACRAEDEGEAAGVAAPGGTLCLPQYDGEDGEDEEEEEEDAGEEDDDDLGDDSDEEFEDNPENLVLAQFEKVSRTKTRWKCQLKAGIMHINGKDYIFNKAVGEFQF